MQSFSVIRNLKRDVENISAAEIKASNPMVFGWIKRHPIVVFRLLVVVGLMALLTMMQQAFYAEHDIIPHFSWQLAIAGDVAMMSLMMMEFKGRWLDTLRISLYGIFYAFVIGSTSFHVLSKIRSESKTLEQSTSSGKQAFLEDQIRILDSEIAFISKRGAYNLVEAKGKERASLRNQLLTVPTDSPAPMGIGHGYMDWANAFILILIRALLSGAAGLNAVALRQGMRLRL